MPDIQPGVCKHFDMRIYLTPADEEYPDTIYSIRCHNCDTFVKLTRRGTEPLTIQDCRDSLSAKIRAKAQKP